MVNSKILADGTAVSVWWALPNAFANWKKPTSAEFATILNVTESIAWDGFSFGAQASNQSSDPSLIDIGNGQSRGLSQFGGSVSFFYPSSYVANASDANYNTFASLRAPGTVGYLIIRVDGRKTTSGNADVNKGIVDGDFISIYKVQTDAWTESNTGDAAFKYTIGFLSQGDVWVNAQVNTAISVSTPAAIGTTAYTVGGKTPLGTYLTGRQLTAQAGINSGYPGWFTWESSNNAILTVDSNAVVRGVAAGTATVTARWKATGTASTALSITIA